MKLGGMAWHGRKGMNMKKTVNFSDFCDAFVSANRDDSFSYEGKKALFDYFEELERDCCEEIELDVIAFCCEYSEYESVQEVMDQYSIRFEDLGLDDLIEQAVETIQEYIDDEEITIDLTEYADVIGGHDADSIQAILKDLNKTEEDLGLELVHDASEVLEALEEYLRDRTQVVCCEADCVLITDY